MLLELHIIQSFSATNLNRDDLNNPKETWFGGVRRARISSQAFKRAVRTNQVFTETIKRKFETFEISHRTKRLGEKLAEALIALDVNAEDAGIVANVFPHAITDKDGKPGKGQDTNVLLFIGQWEVEEMAVLLKKNWQQIVSEAKAYLADNKANTPTVSKIAKDYVKSLEKTKTAPDIALFGRMLAGGETFNREAACQVGHAISTHAVKVDMDFYTAVDDLKQAADDTGAGMMGYIGYNSATYYRYALLDWKHLLKDKNLGGDVAMGKLTVEAFLRAMEAATLTGKKHSFDNNSRPAMMMAVIREENSPGWSMVNAFEQPVRERDGSGFVSPSVKALSKYWHRHIETYGDSSVKAVAICLLDPSIEAAMLEPNLSAAIVSPKKEDGKTKPAFQVWIETVIEALTEREQQQ